MRKTENSRVAEERCLRHPKHTQDTVLIPGFLCLGALRAPFFCSTRPSGAFFSLFLLFLLFSFSFSLLFSSSFPPSSGCRHTEKKPFVWLATVPKAKSVSGFLSSTRNPTTSERPHAWGAGCGFELTMGRRVLWGGLKGAAVLMMRRPRGSAFSNGFPGRGVRVSFSSSSGVHPPSPTHLAHHACLLSERAAEALRLEERHCRTAKGCQGDALMIQPRSLVIDIAMSASLAISPAKTGQSTRVTVNWTALPLSLSLSPFPFSLVVRVRVRMC